MADDLKDLPKQILEKAVLSENEIGWRKADILDALHAARVARLAVIGGQVQFKFPDGTCELYWMNYDSQSRCHNEAWKDWVARSHNEIENHLRHIFDNVDLKREGIRNFDFLKKKHEAGFRLEDYLIFLVYFEREY